MEASNTIVERKGEKKEVQVVIYLILQTTQFALCCQDGSFRQLNAGLPSLKTTTPHIGLLYLIYTSHLLFQLVPHQRKSILSHEHEPTMN